MANMTDRLRDAYDAGAAEYAAAVPDLRAETASDRGWITRFGGLVAASSVPIVTDVGCGHGRMFGPLRTLGVEVVGSDLSPAMVELARIANPGSRVEVAPLHRQPWSDHSVGGVLSWYSLIHTPPEDLLAVCAEWRRILAPDGHVLLAFQHGTGTRPLAWAARHGLRLEARLQSVPHVTDALVTAGYHVLDAAVREHELAHEHDPQGFLLAQIR
jgi:SAM-dependent methyltransferase